MHIVSSLFFIASLILAVTVGPQTRSWSWGPALICLGIASASSIACWWKSRRSGDTGLIVGGGLIAAWFIWRAWLSPVAEFAQSDLLLLTAAIGSCLVGRTIIEHETALRTFLWAMAVLLFASVIVISIQVTDPTFIPFFESRPAPLPSGFFGHYNEGANFLVGSSFLLGAAAIVGKHPRAVRLLWGVIAIAGLFAVYFTRSKSGILSVGVGLTTLFAGLLLYGQRRKAKWFGAAVIALPIMIVSAISSVGLAWVKAQEARQYAIGVSDILFDIRLRIWGIAMSCIGTHPWAGGGSRSFSWECYQFWNIGDYGWHTARPEMAHNELLQLITDYGLIAGIGMMIILITIILRGIFRLLSPDSAAAYRQSDALYIGGLAAIAALLMQSSFNFSLHLLPGAMLLGTAMAFASLPNPSLKSRGNLLLVTAMAVTISGVCLFFGWKGSRVTQVMAPFYFKVSGEFNETDRLYALNKAAAIWPLSTFHRERSLILHKLAHGDISAGRSSPEVEEAISAYRAGLSLNPFDTSLSINLANLLDMVDRNEEALSEYQRAERLQGGMELAFKTHYYLTNHLVKMGFRQLAAGETNRAEESFTSASLHYKKASDGYPSLTGIPEGIALRESVNLGLGMTAEQLGDLEAALETYEAMSAGGSISGKFRAALLLERVGRAHWAERRSGQALGAFLEAREYLSSVNELPKNVTEAEKLRLQISLQEAIQLLTEARVEPIRKSKRSH